VRKYTLHQGIIFETISETTVMKNTKENKDVSRQSATGEDKSVQHTGKPGGKNNYPEKEMKDKQVDYQDEFLPGDNNWKAKDKA